MQKWDVWGYRTPIALRLCVLWPLCVYLDLGPEAFLSCIWNPVPMAGVPGPNCRCPELLSPIWPLAASEDWWVDRLGTPDNFSKLDF